MHSPARAGTAWYALTRLALATVAAAVLSAPAAAQAGPPGGMGGRMVGRYQALIDSVAGGLALKGDLSTKVTAVLQGERDSLQAAMSALMAQGRGPEMREAMMQKSAALRAKSDSSLAGLLSADQMGIYRKIRETWQAAGRGPGMGGPPRGPGGS